jgi:transcriptional regulator with XRE-family HTH domain
MSDTQAQAGAEAAPVSDDVHADVRAAIESLQTEPAAADSATDTAKADRDRNERGQFSQKADAQPGVTAKPVPDTDPNEGKVQQPSNAVEAPTSWSADAKAKWSSLDPSVQAEIAKREKDMNDGGQKWSDEKRRYEETLAPVREVAKRNGVDEKEGLNRLLAANDFLERDPPSALKWLAQAYGVDLANLDASPTARPQADPMVTQLHQELSNIKSTLQAQEYEKLSNQVEQFKSAPGREHFEDAKIFMGKLLETGQASTLEEAYETAIWAIPSIREKLIAAQTATQQPRKDQAHLAKAKAGALSVNGSPVTQAAPAQKREFDTAEDAARAAWAQHMGN